MSLQKTHKGVKQREKRMEREDEGKECSDATISPQAKEVWSGQKLEEAKKDSILEPPREPSLGTP